MAQKIWEPCQSEPSKLFTLCSMNMTQFSAMQQIGRPPNCIDHDTITVSELVIPQSNFLLSFRFILLLGLKSSKDLKTNTLIYSLEFLLVQT